MKALTLFVFLALLFISVECRLFNPILLNTQSVEATTPALYWDSILPNTQMPDSIKSLLKPDLTEEKYKTCERVGTVKAAYFYAYTDQNLPVFYKSKDEQIPFSSKHLNNLLATLMFLEKDLSPRKTTELYLPKTCNNVTFISREVANSIPFSSEKLLEIYNELSIKHESTIAEMMKDTINLCEKYLGLKGEKRRCATSLESMIDFSTSVLGNSVQAISTEVDTRTPLRNYTIAPEIKKMEGGKFVVCHKLNYAYAVFYCHYLPSATAYTVSMVGDDGTMAKVAAMCHGDTSGWDPNHMAFQVLKVKPGTVPVCHFLTPGNILWTNK